MLQYRKKFEMRESCSKAPSTRLGWSMDFLIAQALIHHPWIVSYHFGPLECVKPAWGMLSIPLRGLNPKNQDVHLRNSDAPKQCYFKEGSICRAVVREIWQEHRCSRSMWNHENPEFASMWFEIKSPSGYDHPICILISSVEYHVALYQAKHEFVILSLEQKSNWDLGIRRRCMYRWIYALADTLAVPLRIALELGTLILTKSKACRSSVRNLRIWIIYSNFLYSFQP